MVWIATIIASAAVYSVQPPPPPEIRWTEYSYVDADGRKIPYYHNIETNVSEWKMPPEPYNPAVNKKHVIGNKVEVKSTEMVDDRWTRDVKETDISKSTEMVEWVPGDRWNWDVNCRCANCAVLLNFKQFHKRYQVYGCQLRICPKCV